MPKEELVNSLQKKTMSDQFEHDPEDSREIDPSAPTSFEEAKEAVDASDDASGLGFVVNRHNPFLVVEVANAVEDGELLPAARQILSSLGETFMEQGDGDVYRALYRGELPGGLHGGDPIVVTVGGDNQNFVFRIYDSGWTPLTGRHIRGTPEVTQDVNDDALRQFLSQTGHYED